MEGVDPGPVSLEYRIHFTSAGSTPDIVVTQQFQVETDQSKEAWQAQSRQEILLESQVDINSYSLSGGPFIDLLQNYYFKQNEACIQAVFHHYEKMYAVSNDQLLWGGLAKLAGAPIYAGLSDSQNGRYGLNLVLPLPPIGVPVLTQIQNILMEGNLKIYNDLAWQFDAYRASGIWALTYVDSGSPNLINIDAWQELDGGVIASDNRKISDANKTLLRHEQEDILKLPYQELNALGFGSISWFFSIQSKSPVPGGTPFRAVVPNGNLAKFSDRWTWITQSMWPNWIAPSPSARKTWDQIPLLDRVSGFSLVSPPLPIQ